MYFILLFDLIVLDNFPHMMQNSPSGKNINSSPLHRIKRTMTLGFMPVSRKTVLHSLRM